MGARCRGGGMADAMDSKPIDRKVMRVRLSPAALDSNKHDLVVRCGFIFTSLLSCGRSSVCIPTKTFGLTSLELPLGMGTYQTQVGEVSVCASHVTPVIQSLLPTSLMLAQNFSQIIRLGLLTEEPPLMLVSIRINFLLCLATLGITGQRIPRI